MQDPVQVIFKELVSDPEMFYEAINRNVPIGIAANLNPEKLIDLPTGLQRDIDAAVEALEWDDKLQVAARLYVEDGKYYHLGIMPILEKPDEETIHYLNFYNELTKIIYLKYKAKNTLWRGLLDKAGQVVPEVQSFALDFSRLDDIAANKS